MPDDRLKRTRDLGGPWDHPDWFGKPTDGPDVLMERPAVRPLRRPGAHVLRYDIRHDMMVCLRCGCSYSSQDVAGKDECRWWAYQPGGEA